MKLRIVYLIVSFFAFGNCNSNPITDFCFGKHINQKSIIIAISIEHCSSCIMPPSTLLKEIRKINTHIPVFIITKDTLTEMEVFFLRKLIGDSLRTVKFLHNSRVYDYMMVKKKGIPSVCCVSQGKVLSFKHLKYESLTDFYKAITPNFEIILMEKIMLQNKMISTQKYNSIVQTENCFYTLHSGIKLICKYNNTGENIQNLFIDSLKIDYLEIAARLFNKKEQRFSNPYYSSVKHRNRLFKPVNLFKLSKDTICVSAYFTCYGDTILPENILKTKEMQKLKNKRVSYEQKYACLLLFDTALTYLGFRPFHPYFEPTLVDLYSNGAHANSIYYLGRFDVSENRFVMAEYVLQDSKLTRRQQFVMPEKEEQKTPFIITMTNKESLFVLYSKKRKNKARSVTGYRFNKTNVTFTKELKIDMVIRIIHETPKGNLIFLASQNDRAIIKGYDENKKKLIDVKNQDASISQTDNTSFFVAEGFIQKYRFTE